MGEEERQQSANYHNGTVAARQNKLDKKGGEIRVNFQPTNKIIIQSEVYTSITIFGPKDRFV